jgi:hypothetical protein
MAGKKSSRAPVDGINTVYENTKGPCNNLQGPFEPINKLFGYKLLGLNC